MPVIKSKTESYPKYLSRDWSIIPNTMEDRYFWAQMLVNKLHALHKWFHENKDAFISWNSFIDEWDLSDGESYITYVGFRVDAKVSHEIIMPPEDLVIVNSEYYLLDNIGLLDDVIQPEVSYGDTNHNEKFLVVADILKERFNAELDNRWFAEQCEKVLKVFVP